jgi:hypothetical protein
MTVKMKKGEIKTWFTPGTDLWPEGRHFTFRWHKGWQIRPMARFFGNNPWKLEMKQPWILKFPFPIYFFFFSCRFGRYGFYIGTKVYELDPKDDIWLGELKDEYPYGNYLCFSVRWDK